jgi:hypothetical protein
MGNKSGRPAKWSGPTTAIRVPAEVWAKADRLLDEVCGEMSQKEHWLLLGRLVEEWGQKVPE